MLNVVDSTRPADGPDPAIIKVVVHEISRLTSPSAAASGAH